MRASTGATTKRRWGLALAVLLVLLVALGVGLALRPPQVDAVAVRSAPLLRTLQFSARVATLSRVEVGSTLTGRVAEVLVDEGAQVRQGEPLVRLQAQELQAALAQAQANEQQAQARLTGLRTTGRQSADAALGQAEANLRNARAELARMQKLVDQGFISASRLDEAQRAVAVAEAQRQSALAQAQANADNGTEVAQAQAQLALARAATAAARAKLQEAVIVAPADARVLLRQVEPGQIVQPGKALLTLALAGPTQLVAQVDERFLEQLVVGQRAAVVADAFPARSFAARILSLAPAVDPQRGAIEVKFALEGEPPAFLREDMTLSVEVTTGQRESALVLPLATLYELDPAGLRAKVRVLQDDRVQERVVQLGLRTLDAAEITQGLAAGELVLLDDQLAPGSRVRPRLVTQGAAPAAGGGTSRDSNVGAALGNAMGR